MKMTEPEYFAKSGLRGRWSRNVPMSRHTSWRAGGVAESMYQPAGVDDLLVFLRGLPLGETLHVIGLGSNLLVRDGGIRGTVILLHAALNAVGFDDGLIRAEAGVASPKVARFAATHDGVAAEFLAGVPGTIGGALAMNAGCYGSETWDKLVQVQTLDRQGQLNERLPDEYVTGYRHVALKQPHEEWFIGGWFRLEKGDGAASRETIKDLLKKRIASQPLNMPNAGSVFRNPPGDHAARLVEACGLKGHAIGGARISEKHANFIVNPGGAARASDIEALIAHARAAVIARFGVELVPEVRIIGDEVGAL